jgi:hypothetical protein
LKVYNPSSPPEEDQDSGVEVEDFQNPFEQQGDEGEESPLGPLEL